MDLEISIEEGEFSLESSPIYYVFLIYDVVQKRVLSLRISKSRSSHVDRLRSLHSSIKKTNPNLQENETFFIGNINYVFFNSCNKFSKNNLKKIQTNQPLIIPLLLKFIRKKKEIKSKIILFLFNKFLLGEKNAKIIKIEENEKELFFKIDFYQEEQLLNLELETIFYKRKKAKYSKNLKYLETQQEFLR